MSLIDSSTPGSTLPDLKTDALANNAHLSDAAAVLANSLMTEPKLATQTLNKQSQRVEPFMRQYQYDVSPWPLIVKESLVAELGMIFRQLPLIFHKVLKSAFKSDKDAACRYLNIQQWAADSYCENEFQINDMLVRYDAVVSDGQFKLLEINSGGSLGGWQLSFLEEEAIDVLRGLPALNKWQFKHQNVVENLFASYIQSILRLKGSSTKGNILLYLPETLVTPDVQDNLNENFRLLFARSKKKLFPQGDLYFFTDPDDVAVAQDGTVRFANELMDAVILTVQSKNDLPAHFFAMLEAASIHERFYYPDAFRISALSNKLMFAWIQEPDVQEQLSQQQRDLINACIPYTVRAIAPTIEKQGKIQSMADYVRQNKDRLVLKKAHSMQGIDVYMGATTDAEQWQQCFDKVSADPDWIVQEYCLPDPIVAADATNGLGLYNMVWGIFALQGNFAGGFIRGVQTNSENHVINSARGAFEFLLLEQQLKKKKITL